MADLLNRTRSVSVQGYCLQDWRISLFDTQLLSIGIKNNSGGSVYTPPAYKNSESADIFLVWEDGKSSRARIQKPAASETDNWQQELKLWRMAAFEDVNGGRIPSPAPFPEVRIAAEEIRFILAGNPQYIFEMQKKILSDRPEQALTRANITVLWGSNAVLASTGIDVRYNESRFSVSWSFDSLISEGFAKRRLICEQEWEQLWEQSVKNYRIVSEKGDPVSSKTRVVLAPSIVEEMNEQFIIPNFKGENILEGQSKFTKKDFLQHKKILNEGLTIEIDPTRPYEWGSYRLSAEGIPSQRTEMVRKGKVISPYLNVKDAWRWQASPTGLPAGAMGLTLQHEKERNWPELLADIEDGVLVLSILGLHTQNPVTGNFSLAAPSALRIKNGNLSGKVDVRINGNYWELLNSEQIVFGRSSLYHSPYILTPYFAEVLV